MTAPRPTLPARTAPDSHDAVTFAQCANCNRPDRRIETGDVTAAGEDRNRFLVVRHARKN